MKHELQEIVAVVNNKGGVGKTATVQSLASGMVRLNHNLRILVIDLDPQCNLSSLFGVRDNEYDNIYNAMCKQSGVPVYKCKNGVYAVPGSAQMENIEQHLPGGPSLREQMKSYTVLLSCLQDNDCHDMTGEGLKNVFDDFDYIFIDCPPSLELLTLNALCAANSLLVPVQGEYYALEGLSDLMNTVRIVRRSMNPSLDIEGVLLTMFDGRTNLSIQVAQEVKRFFGSKVYSTVIPRNVRLSEAPSHGRPITAYDRNCRGADAYIALADEFLKRNA